MVDNKKKKNKKKIYTKEEIKILMRDFDKDTYDEIIEKNFIKQLGSAILNQHKKFNLREIIMLICGALGGFGIATIIFGFVTGIFSGV